MFDNRSKYGQKSGPQWIKIPVSWGKYSLSIISECFHKRAGHNNMNEPYPKFWWVNQGQILAGRYPGDLNPDLNPDVQPQ